MMRYGPVGRVLKGTERREAIDHVAIGRAMFEREYEGKRVVPFDRGQVVRALIRHKGDRICLSDGLVRACQRKVEFWKRVLEREEAEGR